MTDPAGPFNLTSKVPQPPLRLRSTVDAASIDRVRVGLEAIFLGRFHALKVYIPPKDRTGPVRKFIARAKAVQRKTLPVVRWLAISGLAISLAFTAMGGLEWNGYRLDLFFAAYFIACLGIWLLGRSLLRQDLMRPTDAILAWRPRPWIGLYRFLAARIAARALKKAQALAPFDAQYDIDGGAVTYMRIKGDQENVQWTLPLQGWYAAGDGFTILFEDQTTFKSAVIMHEPCARLHGLLEGHGVRPLL